MQTTFALFYGNRGTFPETLFALSRTELESRLKSFGFGTISLPEEATRYGAVETLEEARIYARFLEENKGKFDGVILCLPNFGDENGAAEALQDAGVPIYIMAYPDELDKMDILHRRDAFCGKFSIMCKCTSHISWKEFLKFRNSDTSKCKCKQNTYKCYYGKVQTIDSLLFGWYSLV